MAFTLSLFFLQFFIFEKKYAFLFVFVFYFILYKKAAFWAVTSYWL